MTPDEFKLHFDALPNKLRVALNDTSIIVGKKAVDMFHENFQKEGFQDGALQPWKEVKRRQNPKTTGAASSRKILTGATGDLGRSLKYEHLGNATVVVSSDLPYARAQNEGTTTAGRGNHTTIPARKFMGDSAQLDNIIKTELEKKLNNLFK